MAIFTVATGIYWSTMTISDIATDVMGSNQEWQFHIGTDI